MTRSLRRHTLAAATSLALLAAGLAAPPAALARTRAFGPAETLSYSCRYLGITVGKLQVIVGGDMDMSGTKVWPIMALAKTDALFILYPLKNKYVTWWEPNQETTLGNEMQAEERRERRRERVRFLRTEGKASTVREREGKSPEDSSYEVPSETQDLLSALMRMRGKRLAVGDVEEIPVFTGRRLFTLRATVDRRETLKVDAGTYETVVVKVQVDFSGNLKSKREIVIWATDDERHIPVRLDADFAFGSLVTELTSYQKGITSN